MKNSYIFTDYKGPEGYYSICVGPKKDGKKFKSRINRRNAKRTISKILKEI